MTQLVEHAVHLRLLQGHHILQGLDPLLGSIQGYPVAIKPLLHLRKLLINISIPRHQLSEGVIQHRPHPLRLLLLVVNELLILLQSHFVETRLLLHPVQLKPA